MRGRVQAGGQTIAIRIERDNNDNDTEYLHRDHLGSITAMTDSSGEVQNHFSYDAFGKRRFDDWFANPSDSLLYDLAIEPRRGFTGHAHLDNVGLIHMNGRVYDPILGRFTSPDTYVQFPETTQGFNRYTYVNNNPLSYTDPSGHFIGVSAAAIGSFIAANSTQIAVSAALIAAGEAFDEPLLTQVGFAVLAPVSGVIRSARRRLVSARALLPVEGT
ncbi:Rhs family protein [Salinisphaera shabanensis E1L3A]|uniref:Rhs family protein n=1 Tax=Salinisphaera shabanensis E1L3A TaxID=1033802 RepID=U2E689_9GAMM|nr:RHS repeat-associated core domain-containing protein [Salinisphaera shabanensis]ERJ19291.1 Rhs family protein [Salinisphaera shabanensis E1L3A]